MTKNNQDLPVMCKTKTKKWGYRITNPVTKLRVTVGPFINEASALKVMQEAHGTYKKLYQSTEFNFTPAWNNQKDVQYSGEDIIFCKTFPN